MYKKLSALVMLGLACTSCATSYNSRLTKIGSVGTGLGSIDINRRSDGGLMISSMSIQGTHKPKAVLARQFDGIARNTGCVNGAVPRRSNAVELSSDRIYMLSTFYKCS